MSYLNDPVTGEVLQLDSAHQMTGGTYALGGTMECWLNVLGEMQSGGRDPFFPEEGEMMDFFMQYFGEDSN